MLTNASSKYLMTNALQKGIANCQELALLHHDDTDSALEWCEERLLAGQTLSNKDNVQLSEMVFCENFTLKEVAALEAMMELRDFRAGDIICKEGDLADSLYFLVKGEVQVVLPLVRRRTGRISTLPAGAAFGEMAILEGGLRSADIIADTEVTCMVLLYSRLESDTSELGIGIRLKLITNIARGLSRKLRQATVEIKSLKN